MYMILASSSLESFVQLVTVLFIFVLVLAVTYFTTRWMANIQKGRIFNKNLRIVETIAVGNGKSVIIVKAGSKYIVLSVGKDEVNYLTELSESELCDISFLSEGADSSQPDTFSDVMKRLKKRYNDRSKHE